MSADAIAPVSWNRRKALVIASLWLSVLVVIMLSLGILDLLFQGKKKDLIFNDRAIDREFSQWARYAQNAFENRTTPTVHRSVYRDLKYAIDSGSFFYGYEFYRYKKPIKAEVLEKEPEFKRFDHEKFRRLNNSSNSLILRNFSSYYKIPVDNAGYLYYYYTNPPKVKGLPELLTAFWIMAIGIIVAAHVAGWLVYRYLLWPLLSVSSHLDRSFGSAEAVIPRCLTGLEERYNRLALNAYRARLGSRLNALLAEQNNGLQDWDSILQQALVILTEETGSAQAGYYLQESGTGLQLRLQLDSSISLPPDIGELQPQQLGKLLPLQKLTKSTSKKSGKEWTALLLDVAPGDEERAVLLLAWENKKNAAQLSTELYPFATSAMKSFLMRMQHSEMMLEREKTAVGIHLATNMGHDLTNVIATSRWDLVTLEKARELNLLQFDPEKGKGVEAALDGLVSNFRLLQEVVELYRAYGYAERPTMTPMDLGELADKVCDLFRRSSTRKVRIAVDLKVPTSPFVGEQRLLTLALYNLLTNAVESILAAPKTVKEPLITVKVANNDKSGYLVSIQDNGPGVRGKDGRLLQPGEIRAIFDRGYSTKSEGGTGLGLSWVKQIVESVHGGKLRLINRKEGGAEAIMNLTSRPDDDG
jgi:signal transduction histidine kinase